MDWYNPVIAIGTLISAMVSAIVAIFLYQQQRVMKTQTDNLKSQTSEIKKEISNRMRPWIKVYDVKFDGVEIDDNISFEWDEYLKVQKNYAKPRKYFLNIFIENIGHLPSKSMHQKSLVKFAKFTKHDLWKEGTAHNEVFPIVPGERFPNNITITRQMYENSLEHPVYLGLHLGYLINDSDFNTVGKIWKLTKDSWSVEDYWIDEPT